MAVPRAAPRSPSSTPRTPILTQDRTITRKLKEIILAIKIDRSRTKDEILQGYLNTVYFGRGTYGIETAAQSYFRKPASQLTAAEGAVLAALIRSPNYYDPRVNPRAARDRWSYVVDGMQDEGWLTAAQATQMAYPKVYPATKRDTLRGPNGFVVEAVKEELLALGFTAEQIELGGYTVQSTVDRTAQEAAIVAETQVLGSSTEPVSSLTAIAPGDGAIRAMYAGPDFLGKTPTAQLNLSTGIMRQPGSSFKGYVLLDALTRDVSLRTVFNGSSPLHYRYQGVPRTVRNSGNEQCPRCPFTRATAESINTVFEPLTAYLGPDQVRAMAYRAGIPKSVPLAGPDGFTGPSIGIGTYEVHPADMAVGYASIAAKGVSAPSYIVGKVTARDGKVLYVAKPKRTRAFTADVAADATYALQQVVRSGTGTRARLADGRPIAGKTGTTTGSKDAWFVGFTPQLATSVWIGNADSSPLTNVPGYSGGIYGGQLPARIFKLFMDAALAGQPEEAFPDPVFAGSVNNPLDDAGIAPAAPRLRPSARPTPTPSASPSKKPTAKASAKPKPTKK